MTFTIWDAIAAVLISAVQIHACVSARPEWVLVGAAVAVVGGAVRAVTEDEHQ